MYYLIILCFVAEIFLAYMWFRNQWVYEWQAKLVQFGTYKNYIDYDEMFWRFWIWDIEKMRVKS